MSKKHFQAIARALYETRQDDPGNKDKATALEAVKYRLAHVFAEENPRFDRARFIEACETGTTKGMKA